MLRLKKILKPIGYIFLFLVSLLVIGFIYLYIVAIEHPPKIKDDKAVQYQRMQPDSGLYTINNNWFRKSNSGLYELYVEGTAFDRGVINGKLTQELIRKQEDCFYAQIVKMIPSSFYRQFLKYFIAWFNRNLTDNVTEEYKEEIYGVSLAADEKYDFIGSNYQRIMNYHAAHDIGHAIQNLALVGCTSFGTWGAASADSTMIIGRNFDFYVGDKFSEDKIVAFFNPAGGYKYMTVTWGGFTGAVSGMNEQGLAVTINAAKSGIPGAAATPVSLVAKEVLEYAKNIKEAMDILNKRKMFVSESFLIASALDNKAVIVEKTPEGLSVYDPNKNYIVCTNHFQSDGQKNSEPNIKQMNDGTSIYRYKRVMQLLDTTANTVLKTAGILRDQKGIDNTDIGMGNEKAVNQLIAHHSIIFEPKKSLVWVSTAPWQVGKYMAYDLKKIFAMKGMHHNQEIAEENLTIPADSFLLSPSYTQFISFQSFKNRISNNQIVNIDSFIHTNPSYYHTYIIAADYLYKQKKYAEAIGYYQQALTKEVASEKEKVYVANRITLCTKKSKG